MAVVVPFNSRTIPGLNQETYQQLCLTAGLNLRRQLLLAVCDDQGLQQQLASQLETDLQPSDDVEQPAVVVTLHLDPHHPSPLRPILDWLKAHRLRGDRRVAPLFQILGIDQLTRQSPALQNQFLLSLSRLELLLSRLDMSLLLWLPRPWLHKIRRCVPSFWRMRSRLFEFAGDPATAAADPAWARFQPPEPPVEDVGLATEPVETAETATMDWSLLVDDWVGLYPPEEAAPTAADAGLSVAMKPAPTVATPAEPTAPPDPADSEPSSPPEILGTDAIGAVVFQYPQLKAQWQRIQALAQQQAGPLTLAQSYLVLGQRCRHLIESSHPSPELLDLAIEAYRQALSGLDEDTQERCDTLNDLGSLYWLRAQEETEAVAIATGLQRSIDAYQQGLRVSKDALSDDSRACINSNLGATYTLLAGLQPAPAEALKQAVQAYHRALTVRPAETYPLEYANLQNALGAIHWQLSQLEDARNHLHRAIQAYSEALTHRSAQAAPQDYAMLQNNLGIAYWSLAQHERPGFFLERAIEAYQSALAFRTLAADPAGCAATQNNLGTAYWDLAQQHQQRPDVQLLRWQQAVDAYEGSLVAAQRAMAVQVPLSFDVWATLHSAGVVHDHIAQRLPDTSPQQRQEHLQRALHLYNQALEGWQALPERRALLKQAFAHNVRLHFDILGLDGQQQALAQVPRALLSDVLAQV